MNNFWETKTLVQMNHEEWESLCDSCALCCLVKIEDEDTGKVYNTTVACKQLAIETCRCRDYKNRLKKAPMCIQLTLENLPAFDWLPETCAYRRLLKGEQLPEWHPLVTGRCDSVHNAGISVKWFALSEEYVHPDQLEDFVILSDEQ